jgi:hypothetical protein
VIDEIMARQIVEQLPLTTVDDPLTGWNQPIVPSGIPNQPINNESESDDDSLPDLVDAPDMDEEVYVNNINGDSVLLILQMLVIVFMMVLLLTMMYLLRL